MSMAEAKAAVLPVDRTRLMADYFELTKPRLAMLVLITAVVGLLMGHAGPIDGSMVLLILNLFIGTALLAGGAMTLNQYQERDTDALMQRTMDRPIPSGRIAPGEALAFGVALSVAGLAYLGLLVNWLTSVLGFLTIASYLFAYTPLKTRTPLCTIVGAVPGALPPMMGYAAARGVVDVYAWSLFAILFIWQMPHFLAIAWLYREDYARGRQLMLPVVDPSGVATARQTVVFSATLLPITLIPTLLGMAGAAYFFGALVLGLVFIGFSVLVARSKTLAAARQMFLVSVLYLPLLLALMVLNRLPA